MGAGAIGSAIGGMIAQSGQGVEVTLIGRDPHIKAIRENGLRITGIWGKHRVTNLNAVTSPPCEAYDIVFLTVKSHDTKTAARAALPMIGPNTVIVSMQNDFFTKNRVKTALRVGSGDIRLRNRVRNALLGWKTVFDQTFVKSLVNSL